MNKYLSVVIISVLTLSFVVTYAEENSREASTPTTFPQWPAEVKETREAFRAQMDASREAFRAELEKRRDVWRTEIAAKKEEFRKANAETKEKFWNGAKRMLGERFAVAVRNLERAQARVQEVIDTAEEDGVAQALLDDSKAKLEEAKNKIAEIQALIPSTGEEITSELFEQIKIKAREAKDLLKESHKALVDAITELKTL